MDAIQQMRDGLDLFIRGFEAAMREGHDAPVYMTSTQAATELGVHPSTISLWCKTGKIDNARQSGPRGHWRFTRAAFLAAMKRS